LNDSKTTGSYKRQLDDRQRSIRSNTNIIR
jgi:hypothetical protein